MTSYYTGCLQLLFLVGICSQSILGCGYQTCPQQYDEDKIHLHIISHSHDDVGWLKTADEYFYQDVSQVLTNVVNSLQLNKNRKFVQVEMYYFTRWWQQQTLETQNIVQNLVQNGQLSFANGGWCVNDEASANFNQIIDQMTLGIQFIRNTFGECAKPNVSWQIDPFGASREMANLYSLMDFDGHVVNRGHNLSAEFIWLANEKHEIFTTRLHDHYRAPIGFSFENADEITEQNKLQKSILFANLGRQWNKDYGSKGHVLIPFGDEFSYKNSERWYTNLDKLIEVVNQNHLDINLFYSSPHCYIKAIRDRQLKLETKTKDYFSLWTGFYSSRPIIKYLDRYTNNLFQAAKQLEVLAELNDTQEYIQEAANEIAVLQHNDALTGTSAPSVIVDYKQRLLNAIDASQFVISRGLAKLVNLTINPYIYTSANISQLGIDLKDVNEFSVIVYNPLANLEYVWLRIPVDGEHDYIVRYFNETIMRTENVQIVPINDKVRSMVGHSEKYTHELVFNSSLPPLGYKTYIIEKVHSSPKNYEKKIKVNSDNDYVLNGKNFQLIVDGKSGKVKYWNSRRLIQTFQYYISNRTSTSYEFCPNGGAIDMTDYESRLISAIQYNGFAEITQRINDWVWQTIRVYEDKEYVEFDWVIGPVSDQFDEVGKDVIIRFETDLKTDSKFYTDSNGRQLIERIRDEVPRDCMKTKNAISYNYYPINSYAMLNSSKEKMEFTVFTDRPVGVSSLYDGQIELMVHRRLFDDKRTDIPVNDLDLDGKGVIARGKFLVFFKEQLYQDLVFRPTRQNLLLQPIMAFTRFSLQSPSNDFRLDFSGITKSFSNVFHILSMENFGKYESNEILIRLENLYSINWKYDSEPFRRWFPQLNIEKIERTNLVGTGRSLVDTRANNKTLIEIEPIDIATFILTINRKVVNHSSCKFKWTKLLPSKQLPNNSIVAGRNPDDTLLYVCRHQNVDNIPGKYGEKIQCHIPNVGKDFYFNDDQVEILTAPTEYHPRWIPRHGGDLIPESAFVAGKTKSGQPIYIGRCHRHGTVVGKIEGYFYYPYGGVEWRDCPNHQILVC